MKNHLKTLSASLRKHAPIRVWLRRGQLAGIALALVTGAPASALVFNLNFDPDATFTAAGLSAADIVNMKAACNFAASQYTLNFNDPINVNIRITAVPGTGTLGASSTSILGGTFGTVRGGVLADAKTADDTTATTAGGSIPAADPILGTHTYFVSRAEAKALSLIPDSAVTSDGTFTFGGGNSFTYDPNNRAVAGKFDFIGVATHEFSEIMGRIGLMGAALDGNPDYMLYDLFSYTNAAVRGLNNGAGRSFSINNGTTLLKAFNNAALNGGDLYDWASGANDAFNAFTGIGVKNDLTDVDLRVMDVIGYDRTIPEPSAGMLIMSGLAMGCFVARRNRAKK